MRKTKKQRFLKKVGVKNRKKLIFFVISIWESFSMYFRRLNTIPGAKIVQHVRILRKLKNNRHNKNKLLNLHMQGSKLTGIIMLTMMIPDVGWRSLLWLHIPVASVVIEIVELWLLRRRGLLARQPGHGSHHFLASLF